MLASRKNLFHFISKTSFYSKTKQGIFLFFILLHFDFHFRRACLNDLPFLLYKEQQENV